MQLSWSSLAGKTRAKVKHTVDLRIQLGPSRVLVGTAGLRELGRQAAAFGPCAVLIVVVRRNAPAVFSEDAGCGWRTTSGPASKVEIEI
jgi:hypothetical protein